MAFLSPSATPSRASPATSPKPNAVPGLNVATPSSGSATGNPRNKVSLMPGRSLMDWIRLGKHGGDLTGVGGRMLAVTPEELAKHSTLSDAWTAIRGRVYNITPYMEYHPGGVPELMRAAGRESTQLFDEIHKWVNIESMLSKCLVGKLVPSLQLPSSAVHNRSKSRQSSGSRTHSADSVKNTLLPPPVGIPSPRYEWMQKQDQVTIVTYTRWQHIRREHVIIDKLDKRLKATYLVDNYVYTLHLDLEHSVTEEYKVNVRRPSGKVELTLQKSDPSVTWSSLGISLPSHGSWEKQSESETVYRSCRVAQITVITHDTNLYKLCLPAGTRLAVPVGYHVRVKAKIEDVEVVQSYTAVPPSLLTPSLLDTGDKQEGMFIYLMVKVYSTGTLSRHIGGLREGDFLDISDPVGTFHLDMLDQSCHVVMCAAGTGFTPMAGLIHHALLLHPNPTQKLNLLFFNKEEGDILWLDQLSQLTDKHERFSIQHVLSQPASDWSGQTGRIRQDLLTDLLTQSPGQQGNVLFCACGPTAFTEEAVRLAKELGLQDDNIHAFLG